MKRDVIRFVVWSLIAAGSVEAALYDFLVRRPRVVRRLGTNVSRTKHRATS